MLVLARKRNQRIIINGNIVLTVMAINGDKILIGIKAPKSVPIDRVEVRAQKDGDDDGGKAAR